MLKHIGWIPDLPDHRDIPYSELRPQLSLMKAIARPSRVYLHEDNFPAVYNQGSIGSCVGHGLVNICTYATDFNLERHDGHRPASLSRLFAYWIARRNKAVDEGAYIREGVKAVAHFGLPQEHLWPYDVKKWAVAPPAEVFKEASKRAVNVTYYRITKLGDLLDCLAQGYPVIFGAALFDSFDRVGPDGEVSMPRHGEAMTGGHCMTLIGYSMKKKAFFVRNSWGPEWGYHGHCWIPFAYIEAFASDFWTIRTFTK